MRAHNTAPNAPKLRSLLFGLGLVDIGDALAEVPRSLLLRSNSVNLKKSRVVLLVSLGPLVAQNLALHVETYGLATHFAFLSARQRLEVNGRERQEVCALVKRLRVCTAAAGRLVRRQTQLIVITYRVKCCNYVYYARLQLRVTNVVLGNVLVGQETAQLAVVRFPVIIKTLYYYAFVITNVIRVCFGTMLLFSYLHSNIDVIHLNRCLTFTIEKAYTTMLLVVR